MNAPQTPASPRRMARRGQASGRGRDSGGAAGSKSKVSKPKVSKPKLPTATSPTRWARGRYPRAAGRADDIRPGRAAASDANSRLTAQAVRRLRSSAR